MKEIIHITLFTTILLFAQSTFAQNLISVQNGNKTSFYLQVDSAITHSQDGDTIYIPGGSWILNKPINKSIHLIGVGYHPDSTNTNFPTTLQGNIVLAEGSSNGSLAGIFLQGVFLGIEGIIANSYTVTRCRITYGFTLYSSNNNISFIENVLEGQCSMITGNNCPTNCSFYNNIICSYFNNGVGTFLKSNFKNNIFLQAESDYGIHTQYSTLDNNIFVSSCHALSSCINTIVKNNLFVETIIFPTGTNVGSNNLVNQTQNSIFINQEGSVFDYTHDYHLKSDSPGINAGTDGTDIGIYGGIYPWKHGSIPSNPHFQSVKVAPKTDSNGNLNVNIKVTAQDY